MTISLWKNSTLMRSGHDAPKYAKYAKYAIVIYADNIRRASPITSIISADSNADYCSPIHLSNSDSCSSDAIVGSDCQEP